MTNCSSQRQAYPTTHESYRKRKKIIDKHQKKIERYNNKHPGHQVVTLQDMTDQKFCPHQDQTSDGKYVETTGGHDITVNGKTFHLKTCCPMCAEAIQEDLTTNGLASDYICCLGLSHKNTSELVQLAPKK